jgi:UPF0042 nucleotide-binding protein
MKRFVVISGLSGAGKSTALGFFEDAGYFCMDNVPPVLIESIKDLVMKSPFSGAAIVVDVRAKVFGDPVEYLKAYKRDVVLIFLEASKEEIIRRYSLTRRTHPLGLGVEEGYDREREELEGIREIADFIVDTTGMIHKDLRERMSEIYEKMSEEKKKFIFSLRSFAFKHGIPQDSDFVFDARFFPNPHYIPELSLKTGLDDEVREYFKNYPQIDTYADWIVKMILEAKRGYKKEGRNVLYVSVGCSGGRHRSVYIVEKIASALKDLGEEVMVEHRELVVKS